MAGEFPQLTPSMMELAWLQLATADPRTLPPPLLQWLSEMHVALNQRQRQDPYGIVSLTPAGPSFSQQRLGHQQQHPLQPFREAFPLPNLPNPFFGEATQDFQPKTGVTFRPEGTQWGI